jgi:hypothetical protein
MASKAKIKALKVLRAGMRRFALNRMEDETGTSGTGIVAIGTQYPNGHISMTWLSHMGTYVWYDTIEIVKALHGHNNKTEILWLDKEENKESTIITDS